MTDEPLIRGGLVGWRQGRTEHGVVLRLQVARSAADFHDRNLGMVEIALNERQMRSLARDLVRSVRERDVPLFARKPLRRRVWRRLMPFFLS